MPRTLTTEDVAQLQKTLAGPAAEGDNGNDSVGAQRNAVLPQRFPGCLYEHMVKKISPFTVRGILWYQGESDNEEEGTNVLHEAMLTGLIKDWRELWQEQLPFLMVQLPGFGSWLDTVNNEYPIILR